MKPAKHVTAFSFIAPSFEELPATMERYVGYKVKPSDVWSISIHELDNQLSVVLTILYWDEEKVKLRLAQAT